ncbi:MAG: hypothetical protein KJ000_11575 [Pirellulaceae bacterium]|nr:hypothetical protein [Pirellulaceae bacterium]
MTARGQNLGVSLRSQMICPHCWTEFPPHELLWIAAHSDLRGDPLLGQDEQIRFLPSRFSADGKAIDVRGELCTGLACPHCHLSIAWSLLEMQPLFLSILGAPGSGKSYFLSSMTWQLRQTLRDQFAVSFTDADPLNNQVLSEYEERLFLNPKDDQLVYLPKTELEGQLYQSVAYGERRVWYPRPFVFSLQPLDGHIDYDKRRLLARALCLYDNAGEHFLPGGETPNSPSKHLALSEVLFFLFDPTQHPKFRARCKDHSNDPQMGDHGWSHRQDQVLLEAANRIRAHSGASSSDKLRQPLVVIVTKFDAWRALAPNLKLDLNQIVRRAGKTMSALDSNVLKSVSDTVREILNQHARELVAAAEGFSNEVIYIPVSALGCAPEIIGTSGMLGIRPRHIQPIWSEVPLLFALNRCTKGLVRVGTSRRGSRSAAAVHEDETESPVLLKMRETGT